MIQAGSFSRLSVFEDCKLRAKLQFLDKIPEPDRGTPPNGKEWPNDRGTRVHNAAEDFVNGTGEFIEEMMFFEPEFNKLKEMNAQGQVKGEEMWCFDEDWGTLPWDDADPNKWAVFSQIKFRIKTDATVFKSDTEFVIVDYKTGKKFGNEIKHAEQMELYCIGGFLRFPNAQKITTELWYLDQNELSDMEFTRKEAFTRLNKWSERNNSMTTQQDFPPNPNQFTCKWCPYGPLKSGHCTVGVQ